MFRCLTPTEFELLKLLKELGLDESAVIRHYDITEKLCPLYYVEHEDAWKQLKKDIGTKMDE